MGLLLLALFVIVPVIEIALFIEIGGRIGLWSTLGLVFLTAIVGTWLLRAQGLATLQRARGELDAGRLPARELFDGACLLVAGAFLLTPGFFTDGVGFLLLLPPFRIVLRRYFAQRVTVHMAQHPPGAGQGPGQPGGAGGRYRGPDASPGVTIDGNYRDVTEQEEADDSGARDRDRRDPEGAPEDGDRPEQRPRLDRTPKQPPEGG